MRIQGRKHTKEDQVIRRMKNAMTDLEYKKTTCLVFSEIKKLYGRNV